MMDGELTQETVRSAEETESRPVSRILWFAEVGREDTALVGGKAASLGEMYQQLVPKGVRVPNGFATTAATYREFVEAEAPTGCWDDVPADDQLQTLKWRAARATNLAGALHTLFADAPHDDHLEMHGRTALARAFVLATPVPNGIRDELAAAYDELCREFDCEVDAAVRSSATREDSELASFAGQYESFLNVRGFDEILDAWTRCAASAFTERAVSYQLQNDMNPLDGALAVVVMKMVRSDIACSGIMFTLDPESGNPNVLHISSAFGLGEMVVQGSVSPDTFLVWKDGLRRGRPALVHRQLGAKDRKLVYSMQGGTSTESVDVQSAWRRLWSLTEGEVMELGRMALVIEEHYGRAMDIEWAKDGYTGDLYVVQARPETVHSNETARNVLETYVMEASSVERLKESGKVLVQGHAVGTRIGAGRARVYPSYDEVILRKRALRKTLRDGAQLEKIPLAERVFDPGDVLVTEMTTPDWEPMMREAALVVTEKGGRTSHAAIVAREFGIPAIVGCQDATKIIKPLMEVTGSCAEGDVGYVYDGIHPFEVNRVEIDEDQQLRTKIKLNVGFPERALMDALLPSDGVGLARIEFILTAQVGIHPLALLYYEELKAFAGGAGLAPELAPFSDRIEREGPEEIRSLLGAIERRTASYADRRLFFVDQLAFGVALICAAFYPRPVLVRLSDLKSNEYRDLLGGRLFEPVEENPMIAWRGAARYIDPTFMPAFDMECDALRFVRQQIGLDNLQIMVPFCRSPEEGREVATLLDHRGLSPQGGVSLFLMVELPSNVLEADRFIDEMALSGGSIGTNDLVQTVYAVSRDDMENYSHPVDARSAAAKIMIRGAVEAFRRHNLEIGICGQAPSDHPQEVPAFLVECGITSISVTPDTVIPVRIAVAEAEREGPPPNRLKVES
jgi:pyruvate,water dikinase